MSVEKSKKTKIKRILFLLTQDLESPSGLGRYFPISKNLVKQGFSVHIAALHSNYETLDKKEWFIEGVKVSYVAQMHVKKVSNQTKYFGPFKLLWYSIIATWKLLIFTLRNPTDIVVIGKPHPMNSIAGLIGGKLLHAKIILDCDDYEAASNYFSSTWQQWIIKIFENTMPKLVDIITTNTYFNKERMIGLGVPAEKINYLPNGIDRDRFRNLDPMIEAQIRQSLDLEGKKVIAYIGSLSLANHPVDLLIQAFKLVNEKNDRINLLIVGGGKDIDVLKAMVIKQGNEKFVHFVGRVSSDLVPYYYKLAHVTVDPVYDNDSARGRCPLKMFESWAMKTPFLTADVGDRRMLSGELSRYTLAISGNPLDLNDKLLSLLKDDELTSRIVNSNYQRFQNYLWDALVEKFIDLLPKD